MYVSLYAIYDYKVDTFQSFFTVQHDAQAERMFKDAAMDKETIIGRNPKDFALVRLGKISTDSGKVMPEEPGPKFFESAYAYVKAESPLIGEGESD